MMLHPTREAVGLFPKLFFLPPSWPSRDLECYGDAQSGDQGAPLITFKRNNSSKVCPLAGRKRGDCHRSIKLTFKSNRNATGR